MKLYEIFLIAIGLAMDAFAVSICKGLTIKKQKLKSSIIIASYFGLFQALMPMLGYYFGTTFKDLVLSVDHWIAFILLSIIGGNMIKESFNTEKNNSNESTDVRTMLILSVATSIDALAVGITFSLLKINIFESSSIIGIITFILSLVGAKIGGKFGEKFQKKSELLGGIILVTIGTKILLEHLGII